MVNTVKWQRKEEKVLEREDFFNNRDNLTKIDSGGEAKGRMPDGQISSLKVKEIISREINFLQD